MYAIKNEHGDFYTGFDYFFKVKNMQILLDLKKNQKSINL